MQCEQWGGFRFLLEGCQLTAFVDHKPLKFTMAKTLEPLSGSGSSQHPTSSPWTSSMWRARKHRMLDAFPGQGCCPFNHSWIWLLWVSSGFDSFWMMWSQWTCPRCITTCLAQCQHPTTACPRSYILKDLLSARCVFTHHNSNQTLLQAPVRWAVPYFRLES